MAAGRRLLITYVAGPYPDAAQCRAIRDWLEAGGHWLALHGTSGGRAQRVEGVRNRRTVKTEHHALLGSYFLTHPPICEIRVEVRDRDSPLTRGLGASFVVEDEPYFVELQDPASTRILLTADYGASGDWPVVGTLYGSDTSLLPDGRTRVLGYSGGRQGGVTYIALGHCHNPAIRATRNRDPVRQDAAAVSRPVGDRGVHDPAAQRDRVGRRPVGQSAPREFGSGDAGNRGRKISRLRRPRSSS